MTWTPRTSAERREAIGRAARAVIRLAIDPSITLTARRQNTIVNEVTYTDREAWDAVAALEDMVISRGLVTAEQADAQRRAAAVAVLMGEDVAR